MEPEKQDVERQATSSAFSRSRIVQAVQQEKQDVLMVLFSGQPGSSKQPIATRAELTSSSRWSCPWYGKAALFDPENIYPGENQSPPVVTSYSNNFPSDLLFLGPASKEHRATGTVAVRG